MGRTIAGRTTPNALVRRSIQEIMPTGEKLSRQDIKDKLLEAKGLHYGTDYSEGNLSSALYTLTNTGFLQAVGWGIYQKVSVASEKDENKIEKANEHDAEIFANRQKLDEKNSLTKDHIPTSTYKINDVVELFARDIEKIKDISREICAALKNVDLCNGATAQELEALKPILAFKEAIMDMLEKYK